MAHNGNGRITRLRRLVIAMVFVVVFAAFAAPVAVIVTFEGQANETQLLITCLNARANIAQLTAVRRNGQVLDDIAHSLGLPVAPRPFIPIPEVPSECVAS